MSAPYSEIELLKAFQAGEDSAFTEVYEKYSRQLLFFTERLTGNKEVAEDIVADSFIKLMKRQENFSSLQKLKSYLFRIARNAGLDWLRAEKRHSACHDELKYLNQDAENEIEQIFIRSQIINYLYQEIENLPFRSREIITRSYLHGESLQEIAQEMKLAYKTIQNVKAKAVQQLRFKLLKDKLLNSPILPFFCITRTIDLFFKNSG